MINELITRYPVLSDCRTDIENAEKLLTDCFEKGGKLLLCGNGGSCADCSHIVGELMKGFLEKRPIGNAQKETMKKRCPEIEDRWLDSLQLAVPAISLPDFTALNSAFCNDVDPELIYAQAVMGLGKPGDILLAISTSGNSKNAYAAAVTARAAGLTVIGLTGKTGGKLKDIADVCIRVPETETYKIQELHLPVYHCLCADIEKHFFGQK